MSYQVLARKWRPQNFKEMVGQQHVLKALINALDGDRLHHAYLFTGTRGVGKTTIARVLAKCLNCEKGVTSEPCGFCSSCQEITEGRFVDLIEVDAASRTKIEDTRELLDNVQYAPTRGRFKVYLIDEVHMLSGHSFNALLKTLEEPPSHVKFLFATTDPQKLPVTILSRCLQFNLKRMTVDMISEHLATILTKEAVNNDRASLRLVARAADGSMRDALSLLDQAISFGAGALKEIEVREMLGTISNEPLIDLLKAVAIGDGGIVLERIEQMAGITPDFEAATDALIGLLHKMAVLQIVPQAEEDDETVQQLANQFSKEDVQLYYQIALHGRRDLPLSPDPRSGFEMIFLRLLTFRSLGEVATASTPSLLEEKKATDPTTIDTVVKSKTVDIPHERKVINRTVSDATHSMTRQTETVKINTTTQPKTVSNESPIMDDAPPWGYEEPFVNESNSLEQKKTIENDLSSIKKPSNTNTPSKSIDQNLKWHQIVPKLTLTGQAAELSKRCILNEIKENKITLLLDKSGEDLLAKTTQLQIETALKAYYNESICLLINVQYLTDETPAERTNRKNQERQETVEALIKNDPFIKELDKKFKAHIVPNSIKPT
jgi:DNA polymerase-3 subunit gamma/tau